jgi:hypothetical protein
MLNAFTAKPQTGTGASIPLSDFLILHRLSLRVLLKKSRTQRQLKLQMPFCLKRLLIIRSPKWKAAKAANA